MYLFYWKIFFERNDMKKNINDKKVFYKLKDAQEYYLDTYDVYDETYTVCRYLNEEVCEEFCNECKACLYKNSEEYIAKLRRKGSRIIRRIIIDLMLKPADTFLEMQRDRKNARGLAYLLKFFDQATSKKFKKYIDKNYYTLKKAN